jgi:uncharacterized protein YgbK (DUF1537 family)
MPTVLFRRQAPVEAVDHWANEVARAFQNNVQAMVMMAIGSSPIENGDADSSLLTHRLAQGVSAVLKQVRLSRVLLEGGATASAVLGREGWARLEVGPSIAPGLARLRPHGTDYPELLIKPGSYEWPEAIWRIDEEKA